MLYLTKRFYSHDGQVFDRLSGEVVPIEDVLEQLAAHEDLLKAFTDAAKYSLETSVKEAYEEAAECVAQVME
jgi:vacuolar-type H+-ATPase subunit H